MLWPSCLNKGILSFSLGWISRHIAFSFTPECRRLSSLIEVKTSKRTCVNNMALGIFEEANFDGFGFLVWTKGKGVVWTYGLEQSLV